MAMTKSARAMLLSAVLLSGCGCDGHAGGRDSECHTEMPTPDDIVVWLGNQIASEFGGNLPPSAGTLYYASPSGWRSKALGNGDATLIMSVIPGGICGRVLIVVTDPKKLASTGSSVVYEVEYHSDLVIRFRARQGVR